MSSLPRSELADILFQEIASYLPEISHGLSKLETGSDGEAASEVHRLFHNIKGAASQVQFTGLSNAAAICEAVLDPTVESGKAVTFSQLQFISSTSSKISQFCESAEKSTEAEKELLHATLTAFRQLLTQLPPGEPVQVPDAIRSLLGDMPTYSDDTVSTSPELQQTELIELQKECREIIRSILPLLQELAECTTPQNENLPLQVVRPVIRSLSTLAYCSHAAGFFPLEQLIRHFLDILYTFQKHPESTDSSTPSLVQEFLSYLDLIFSMPPDEDTHIISVVQGQLCKVIDSLSETSESSLPSSAISTENTHELTGDSSPFASSEENGISEREFFDHSYEETESFFSNSEEEELRDLFLMECDEHVLVMNNELQTIDLDDDQTAYLTEGGREVFHRMRVAAHTLKGAAAMTGFSNISESAFSIEKFLSWLHEDSELITGKDLDVLHEGLLVLHSQSETLANGKSPTSDENCSFIDEHLEERQRFDSSSPEISDEPDSSLTGLDDQADELLSVADLDGFTEGDELIPEIEEDTHASFTAENPELDTSEEDELFAIFQAECAEHLLTTTNELNSLTHQITERTKLTYDLREQIMTMRRSVHTLKGAAAMTGFQHFAGCSHALEDMLDWLHDDASSVVPEDISLIADIIDQVEGYTSNPGLVTENDEKLISDRITDHLENRSTEVQVTLEEPLSEGESEQLSPQFEVVQEKEEAKPTSSLPADSGNIRVKLDDLEELVSIEGELVVSRGSVEKLLDRFSSTLEELNTMKETLRRKSQELEVGFEAQSLYGFGAGSPLIPGDDEHATSGTMSEFDPIELDRYSQLNLIIRSLNELSVDVNAIHHELITLKTGLQGQVARQQLSMNLMQEKLMRIRMTPLSEISNALFRTVRQTGKRLEKDVTLQIVGQDVLMDRFIWTKTIDPLMHILRNCIDHGIEDGDARQEAGKPATGQIRLEATQTGRMVILSITDDGQGIDTYKLRKKLIDDGIVSAESNIDDQQLLNYLFRPSVSTKDDISDVSGRGVGLDVVARNIQELRGTTKLINHPGQGLTFELSIPITLSVNRAIIIETQGKQYAVPIQDITEVRRFSNVDYVAGESPQVRYNENEIPLYQLAPYLNQPSSSLENSPSGLLTLVFDNGEEQIALQVDHIEEQREVVIKDLGSHLRYVKGISGVTLTGEGDIIPILNLRELVSVQHVAAATASSQEVTVQETTGPLKVLIVDDSISVRYSLNRLIKSESWLPYQAVDGVDALEKLETLTPDVIILDIEMPRMNGYEFMGVFRSNQNNKDIPVIMLTSRASDKHRKKAEELGVNHYMTKPFQEDDFIDLLKDMEKKR